MGKDDKRTLTPRLRFPEFSAEWEEQLIAPYLKECSSRVAATTKLPIYTSARAGLKPQEEYYGGRTIVNDGEYGVVPPKCFVFRHMSDDGQFTFHTNETGSDIAVSKEYPVFRAVNLDRRFLLAKLNYSPDFKAFALSQKAGGTRTRLYFNKLRTWVTLLPCLAEQQKIADCLTSLDEVIAAQGRKVEALKAHRKGLMQQLFPREGETLPRLRFPEFRDEPDWEIRPLLRVAENLDNKRVPITEKDRTKGEVPYYGASGIVDHVDGHIFDEDLLCVSEDGANLVARTYPIAFAISGKTWVNNHAHVLRFDDSATQKLVEVYLNATDLRDVITGIAQPKLNRAMLDAIPIPLPGLTEQQRIADCLSALDAGIAAESDKLAALKTHQKGLMQQLFPWREED
jgi:type I restriction enzyme S subunit